MRARTVEEGICMFGCVHESVSVCMRVSAAQCSTVGIPRKKKGEKNDAMHACMLH